MKKPIPGIRNEWGVPRMSKLEELELCNRSTQITRLVDGSEEHHLGKDA